MGSSRSTGIRGEGCADGCRPGFTLIDLLVSIAVIALLIGLLLPSLQLVHETSRRIVCASNLRQIGLGVHMYTTDNDAWLPPSSFASGNGEYWNTDPLFLRVDARQHGYNVMVWDGLGQLYDQSYLSDGQIFYCPSHTGSNTFERYAPQFSGEDGEIIANFQYRGVGPDVQQRSQQRLDFIVDNAALVSDGFREIADINHDRGMNVLRAGMSVGWFSDTSNSILDIASRSGEDGDDPSWDDRWRILDQPSHNSTFWGDLFN